MEVHLDLIGGLAGDMFIAALLDAMPQYEPQVIRNIQALDNEPLITCSLAEHNDGVLQGRRFCVRAQSAAVDGVPYRHPPAAHVHTPWAALRARLRTSALPPEVSNHAIGIFQVLADAEAQVHGVSAEAVAFHEAGAWDSIADIVGAATLIHALGAERWTFSAIPLGSGRVNTQHGIIPIPAPATARLLIGMPTMDDGVAGERVTPTGAALLRYLHARSTDPKPAADSRVLRASGTGFGTRVLAGISNHVRVLCFERQGVPAGGHRRVQVIEFEVDDQTAEDLAAGLDRLRAHPAVLDVVQHCVYGKKGRMMAKIQVLAQPGALDAVIDACFRETTTIGLRYHAVQGIGLERRVETVRVQDHDLRVKLVHRPGGMTAKTESDDLRRHEGHALRAALRNAAECVALECATLDRPSGPADAR